MTKKTREQSALVRVIAKATCTLGCAFGTQFIRFELSIGDEADLPLEYARVVAKEGLVHVLGDGEDPDQLGGELKADNAPKPLLQRVYSDDFAATPSNPRLLREPPRVSPLPPAKAAIAPVGLAAKVE